MVILFLKSFTKNNFTIFVTYIIRKSNTFLEVKRKEVNRLMEERRLLKQLDKWLATPGNSHAKLASMLHYKSSNCIYFWTRNKHIPSHVFVKLKEILNDDAKSGYNGQNS